MKRTLLLILTILVIFLGSGFIAYLIVDYFHPYCYINGNYEGQFVSRFNQNFVATEYTELKDLGKSFLTILVASFVASITFSEKIVNYSTTSWWGKSLLIVCWILLLLSIVLTGTGLAFLAACFNQAIYVPCPDNVDLYRTSFICFILSGLSFGLALTSMLCAGVVTFIHPAPSTNADMQINGNASNAKIEDKPS
ncbi:hypothetical protein [Hymenobacter ruricola]|uniref:DUF2975 domain-containing protein n=1 Tax=Hymenobacter ruricola TaxID=2791023 RepID=A0ABS0I4W1_9BACT|nr:hypothetical protein [Hymenobacter ruricola]MBF9221986.1 hypothetical protein [Hymenobacter ruricola]